MIVLSEPYMRLERNSRYLRLAHRDSDHLPLRARVPTALLCNNYSTRVPFWYSPTRYPWRKYSLGCSCPDHHRWQSVTAEGIGRAMGFRR